MKPFKPFTLPIENLNYSKLIDLVSRASRNLSMYNGMLQVMINPNILLAPMVSKEAVQSSKIEGTQVSLTELMENEANREYNDYKQNEIDEVINYKTAILKAESMFLDRPFIHLNMVRDLHRILLSGVRGNNKARGEFRRNQVYIGSVGCTIENATFVPPEAQDIMPALDNWEKYINSDIQESLLQCAIMHAQFEMIHPFLDGNGRIGRMLIPLFLYQKQYISKPVFYMSEYFEKNRQEYYLRLNNISSNGNWDSWIRFFLLAIIEQSNENINASTKIIDLYNNMKTEFLNITHSEFAIQILDNLFRKPIISSNELAKLSGIRTNRTANDIFKKLVNNSLINVKEFTRGNRPTIYSFSKLIELVEN